MRVSKKNLNEDIGFSSGATNIRVKDNVVKTGGRYKLPQERIVLRRPTKEEIAAAGTNPSDYQIGQVRIFSKVLNDFGLVSKVYRSKVTPITKSNVKLLDKYKAIFRTFLGNFSSNEPAQNVRNVLELIGDDSVFTSSDYVRILKATNNWTSEQELLKNIAIGYREANEYGESTEPSDEDVRKARSIYNKLSNFVETELKLGHDKKDIEKSIIYANNVNNVMENQYMQGARKLLYSDTTVENVSDLEAEINEYIDSQFQEGRTGHSNTLIHEEARKNLQELALKLKRDGYEGGLTTKNVFDYLKANEPEIIEHISSAYDIPESQLSGENFPTWESLAKFFYSPENIRKIEFEHLKVNNRARSAGDVRKGSILTNDAKAIASRKKTLQNKIKKLETRTPYVEVLEQKLKLKEEEYQEAVKTRDEIKSHFDEAKELEDEELTREIEIAYLRAKDLTLKIGRSLSHIKHKIKQARENPAEDKLKESDIEKLRKIEEEERATFERARAVLDDNADIRDLEKIIDKIGDTKKLRDYDSSELDYYTWSFVLNTTNEKIIKFVVNGLTKGLNKSDEYINVDAYDLEYDDDEVKGTQIIVDYPNNSNLYKTFEENPMSAYKMMNSIVAIVKKKLGVNISYYKDEEYIKINKQF